MSDLGRHHVRLASEADVDGFRAAVRRLLSAGIAPEQVEWQVASAASDDLFGAASDGLLTAAAASPPATIHVPPFFVPLCQHAALHADRGRFGLLYRLLWRLMREPTLRGDPLDPDRLAAEKMAREVRRDMHKMTAFVRFRPIGGERGIQGHGLGDGDAGVEADADEDAEAAATDAGASASASASASAATTAAADDAVPRNATADVSTSPWHVAWFEPLNHIVEATAPFFARRFAQMRWAILTPERSVRWDGTTLAFGPGARRDDSPPADAGERLWLTYYEHIFNPARLKLAMMQKEMPRRYWHNLPEAVLIQPLTALAHTRSGQMVDAGGTEPARRRPAVSLALRNPAVRSATSAAPATLAALRDATEHCRECPIGALATQAVPGEGPEGAALMLVGEQPGDQEDLRGHPFVGPAGQLLGRAFEQLGWPRDSLYLTNAVKHFKYELRGTRRIHKTAAQREAAACLHWLESEIDLVRPRALVALGATAARSLLGRDIAVTRERGQWLARADGRQVLVTLHPSALLRMDPGQRDAAMSAWLDDLRHAGHFVGSDA